MAESIEVVVAIYGHENVLGVLVVVLFLSCVVSAQAVSDRDLRVLEGGTWVGTLVYLDYGSGKRTEIKSNLNVAKKSDGGLDVRIHLPDEPKANGSSAVALAENGTTFNGQTVTSKQLRDGTLQIVTTKDGDDNSKKAVFRYTYSVTPKTFSIKKEVQYLGESEWFERNTYSWTR